MASFEIGEWVVANHHRRYEPGRIIAVVTLHDFDGKKPRYRIDFGRFTLHLTADEISPTDAPDPGAKVEQPPSTRKRPPDLTYTILGDDED